MRVQTPLEGTGGVLRALIVMEGHRRPSKNWDAVQYELGAFFVWIGDAWPDENNSRLVISVRKRNLRLNSVRKSRRKPFASAINPHENGFRLAGQLPLLQFNFQFGFVFVEVIAHIGDGK